MFSFVCWILCAVLWTVSAVFNWKNYKLTKRKVMRNLAFLNIFLVLLYSYLAVMKGLELMNF